MSETILRQATRADADGLWRVRYAVTENTLTLAATAHLPGWPAPASRQLAESVAKYIVVDMFAKACGGASTKDVIKSADAQLKEIYRSA